MARIRSDKPESYQSETLAEVSLAAERTFRGMATIADDRGRLTDKPAQINGELWAMRSEREPHTRHDLEAELAEMLKVDLVCRYIGCDGKRYLHLVRWDSHQKIDRPSKSRLPRCPDHQAGEKDCGLHEGACIAPETAPDSPDTSRDSRETSRDLQQVQTGRSGNEGDHARNAQGELIAGETVPASPNGHHGTDLQEQESSRDSREASMLDLGSRTVDLGSRTVDLVPHNVAHPAPPKQKRGTRIPDDFPVTPEMVDWARLRCPNVDGRIETEKFINHWSNKPGREALKLDWKKAWQNWMLTAEQQAPRPRVRGTPSEPQSAADQRRADVARLREIDRQQRGEHPSGTIQGSVIA